MKVLLAFMFSAAMLFTPAGLKQLTQGFRVAKLRLAMPHRPDWELPPLQERSILDQPFFYLARGAQCYVFVSRDGHFVLKLFRYDPPLNPLRDWFRIWVHKREAKTPFRDKIERLFSACVLADRLKEETGLLYAHLNLTSRQLPSVALHIPLGRVIHLPLDRYRFALQKKGETAQEAFAKAYAAGDWAKGKKLLKALCELLERRAQKGVRNLDLNIGRNFGFIDGKAVEIDFGNYIAAEESEFEKARFDEQVPRFLAKVAPEWSDL